MTALSYCKIGFYITGDSSLVGGLSNNKARQNAPKHKRSLSDLTVAKPDAAYHCRQGYLFFFVFFFIPRHDSVHINTYLDILASFKKTISIKIYHFSTLFKYGTFVILSYVGRFWFVLISCQANFRTKLNIFFMA